MLNWKHCVSIKSENHKMETLRVWKNYVVENYNSLATEMWQLGSDAKVEAANMISDLTRMCACV